MKEILENKRRKKHIVKYALRKYSNDVVSVAISACFIVGALPTAVYSQSLESTIQLTQNSETKIIANNNINNILNYTIKNTNAEKQVELVKDALKSVNYEDLYDILSHSIKFLDKINITNELTKELGRTPTDDEVNARIRTVYMDMLDLKESFNRVKNNLDSILKNVFEQSTSVNTDTVIAKKYQILIGLSYLDRQYGFDFNGIAAKDLILYDLNDGYALNRLIDTGTVTYKDLELQNNLTTYTNKIAKITNESDILNFIENSIKRI